ncbi:MAG: class I SAM-dependent RNA methyltransferase [Tissierellia bacterium]|nr:class I SAM-dependent RNA methyltransferase [Tissierellia bacterium]
MTEIQCMAAVNFGIEAVAKRECETLGLKNINVENGRVFFTTDIQGVFKANLWLRTVERVHIVLGRFKAYSFEELFEGVYALPWEDWIPKDGNFVVNGRSVKSKLYSISHCQSITEKAIVKRLQNTYPIDFFPKSGHRYGIEVSLLKDEAMITLDTSGEGLHKRGYREKTVKAPISETLAAAMIQLSFWNRDRILADPFCGSGTIPIEAAMIGKNIAPGLGRSFDVENWNLIPIKDLKEIKKEAYEGMDIDQKLNIYASDISPRAIKIAKSNAEIMGLEDDITFLVKDIESMDYFEDYGVLITNPPYGERIGKEDKIRELYTDLGHLYKDLKTWSFYVITSYQQFIRDFGKKPDRIRRLYNGRIDVGYYQYYGPRPPRK